MSGSGEHRSDAVKPDFHSGSTGSQGGFADSAEPFVRDNGAQHGIAPFLHGRRETDDRRTAGIENGFCLLGDRQSARKTFTTAQIVIVGFALAASTIALFAWHEAAIIAGSVFFSAFYWCVVVFRAAVLAELRPPPQPALADAATSGGKTYVILVALYREANQVTALAGALERLRWPGGSKNIHLVCEEGDHETIQAVAALRRHDIGLLIVPAGQPRTKPRALNFALNHVEGDYLVLYDAEDRPHPDQLLEAANRFANGPDDLVCLQAPLSIDNRNETLLTRFFAIEYDTLFRGILPALALWNSPLPLGGTSNHFKLVDLKEMDGWDSFNVTEDADLGIRIARHRKTCETLALPTHEEAPPHLKGWMRQRNRWIKGWLQTLLVHLRNPLQTAAEMGWQRFLQFHMVLTSVVVSVLVHPFFLTAFVFQMMNYFQGGQHGTYELVITGLSAFNLAGGYLTYGLLAWAVQDMRKSRADRIAILMFPIYWLLISIAGWWAVLELLIRPHHWAKTDHGSAQRETPAHGNG